MASNRQAAAMLQMFVGMGYNVDSKTNPKAFDKALRKKRKPEVNNNVISLDDHREILRRSSVPNTAELTPIALKEHLESNSFLRPSPALTEGRVLEICNKAIKLYCGSMRGKPNTRAKKRAKEACGGGLHTLIRQMTGILWHLRRTHKGLRSHASEMCEEYGQTQGEAVLHSLEVNEYLQKLLVEYQEAIAQFFLQLREERFDTRYVEAVQSLRHHAYVLLNDYIWPMMPPEHRNLQPGWNVPYASKKLRGWIWRDEAAHDEALIALTEAVKEEKALAEARAGARKKKIA